MADDFNILDFATGGSEPFRGALARLSNPQSIANNTLTKIIFDTELYDTDNIWDAAAGGDFVVPAGVTKVKFKGEVAFSLDTTGYRYIVMRVNNVFIPGVGAMRVLPSSGDVSVIHFSSPVLDVVGSDILTVHVQQTSGAALDVQGAVTTWGTLEVIE